MCETNEDGALHIIARLLDLYHFNFHRIIQEVEGISRSKRLHVMYPIFPEFHSVPENCAMYSEFDSGQ